VCRVGRWWSIELILASDFEADVSKPVDLNSGFILIYPSDSVEFHVLKDRGPGMKAGYE